MTTTIKAQEVNNYYIEIAIDKFSTVYKVRAYYYGRLDSETYHATLEKAKKRFSALVRKYK